MAHALGLPGTVATGRERTEVRPSTTAFFSCSGYGNGLVTSHVSVSTGHVTRLSRDWSRHTSQSVLVTSHVS
eukprot:2240905-Rhodomonas_salina.2